VEMGYHAVSCLLYLCSLPYSARVALRCIKGTYGTRVQYGSQFSGASVRLKRRGCPPAGVATAKRRRVLVENVRCDCPGFGRFVFSSIVTGLGKKVTVWNSYPRLANQIHPFNIIYS